MLQIAFFSVLNGVLFGLLLFMLSSGLTLIFSMMGVLNFAHASLYMLGAYFAYSIGSRIGFWPALFMAPILVGLVGAAIERFGLRRVHASGPVAELLFTFGLAYLIDEGVKLIWGRTPVTYHLPAALTAPIFTAFGSTYPAFRILMTVAAFAMLGALWLLLQKTRIGLIVQAALTHPKMVGSLGHDVPMIFMTVFGLGCAMAGVAGVIGGSLFVTEPGMAFSLGPIVFVVIVVGGMGSLTGAFVASLLIGLMQTAAVAIDSSIGDIFALIGIHLPATSDVARITVAQTAPLLPFALLIAVLIISPRGLMGVRET
jgi:branched-chain amino acid transport system permease protein